MPRAALAAGIALATSFAAPVMGCGTDDEAGVPVACKAPSSALLRALDAAPGPVTLDGTPLSDCFARAGDAADVQAVGFAFIDAASALSADARAGPGGDDALELGYLVAAARKGASETPGIYDELIRRLEQELRGVDTGSQAFLTGERAGRESG